MDILPGFQVGMQLVQRAQAMKDQQLNMTAKLMEMQQNEQLFPLKLKELQTKNDEATSLMKLRDYELNNAKDQTMGLSALADTLSQHPEWTPQERWFHAVGVAKDKPAVANTKLFQDLHQDLLSSDKLAAMEKARLDREAQLQENRIAIEKMKEEAKMNQIKATTDAAMARQLARIEAPGKMATHADLAIFKSKVEALVKSPEFSTWNPAKQQRTIDAMGDELKAKMKPAPKDETTADESSDTPVPETSPAMATPPGTKTITQSIALDFLKKAGGNKDKARRLAREAGFEW